MLLVLGLTAMWLGWSQVSLSYVRGWLRLPLAASGAVLVVLALTGMVRRGGHGHAGDGHGHGGARSAWLLIVPVLVLLLVTPPALGSYAASRRAPASGGAAGDLEPLPEVIDGAVPLGVTELVTRAGSDEGRRSLAGVRVRMLGFVVPDQQGRAGTYSLARFNFFCCAADSEPYLVGIQGDGGARKADQWLLVEGVLAAPAADATPDDGAPALTVDEVSQVGAPADRYEHSLYAP
jgi:uncharacterized repeat protein (TIGR03943 family)